MIAWIRFVLPVGLLAACAAAPVDQTTDGSGSPFRVVRPSPSAVAGAVTAGSARATTALRGSVYNAAGQLISLDLFVRVRGTAGLRPFERTIEVFEGRYFVTDVPVRSELTITVVRHGKDLVSRTRPAIQSADERVVLNFGGPVTPADGDAPRYAVPAASN